MGGGWVGETSGWRETNREPRQCKLLCCSHIHSHSRPRGGGGREERGMGWWWGKGGGGKRRMVWTKAKRVFVSHSFPVPLSSRSSPQKATHALAEAGFASLPRGGSARPATANTCTSTPPPPQAAQRSLPGRTPPQAHACFARTACAAACPSPAARRHHHHLRLRPPTTRLRATAPSSPPSASLPPSSTPTQAAAPGRTRRTPSPPQVRRTRLRADTRCRVRRVPSRRAARRPRRC